MKYLLVVAITCCPLFAQAHEPTNWIFQFNQAQRQIVHPSVETYERIADGMEKQDYVRYSELAGSKVYDKNLSPWRPLPIEREAVYGWILKLRIDILNEMVRVRHFADDKAREDVGVAYRRLARVENLHLYSRLLILRAQTLSEGESNIGGWEAPLKDSARYKWVFYFGGNSTGVPVDNFRALYEKQTGFRQTHPLLSVLSMFTLRFLWVNNATEEIQLEMLRDQFNVEVEDQYGAPLKLPKLEEMAAKERERVRQELEQD